MTKKTLVKILTILAGIALFVACYSWCSWNTTHYTKEAKVIEIKKSNVLVIDNTENIWMFEGTGYKVNDEVMLTMNTNFTDSNIYDDRIEEVKTVSK